MKFGVITFPGSNCDYDAYTAAKVVGEEVEFLWHQDTSVKDVDVVILPGGFAHGDYLRSGAIARFSPIMKAVKTFAAEGGLVYGICNGFQVLLESGLLPGALIRNKNLRFLGRDVYIRVERNDTPFTSECNVGDVLKIPIAHKDGNFYHFDADVNKLKDNNQIVFRYCDPDGNITQESNLNGSADNIAGIISEAGNVMGMMPHPERAMEKILGSDDGVKIFNSICNFVNMGVSCEKA